MPGAGQVADNAGVSEVGPAADGVLSGPGGCAEQPFGAVRDLPHLPAPGHGELLVSPGEGAVLRHVLLRGARAVSRAYGGGTAEGRPVAGAADGAPGDGAGALGAAQRAAKRAGALPSEAEKVNERPPGSPGRALYMLFAWEKFLRSALYLGIIQNMYYVLNPCGGSFFASQRTFALDRPLMAAGARSCIPPRSGRDRRWTRFW